MDVDWQSLMNDYNPPPKPEPTAASDIMKKFTPGNFLARIGVSRNLAGPELMKQIEEVCAKTAEEEGKCDAPHPRPDNYYLPLYPPHTPYPMLSRWTASSRRNLEHIG